MAKRVRELWFPAFSFAVIGVLAFMLTQIGPRSVDQTFQPTEQTFQPSAPAWPPNALGRATG
jgi:hypothetical protein